jgi:predicted TIM-barrel fold metal-dependent hydrolase
MSLRPALASRPSILVHTWGGRRGVYSWLKRILNIPYWKTTDPMTDANSGNPAVRGARTRRRWLRDFGAGVACLPVLLRPPRLLASDRSAAGENGVVVDTHLHCFSGAGDARFPYHPGGPYQPQAKATPEHLLRCMNGAGVDFAVVVHPEPYQDDHRYLEHCLEVGAGRLKGTCLFFADRPESLQRMPQFLGRNRDRIVAARLHAYAPDRLPPFGTLELDRLWRTAAEFGIAMQIHFEPRYAEALDHFVRKYSSTRIIIDHLGRPMQGTPEEHAVVMKWSQLPHTIMKLSSIPSRDKYPHRDVAPIIKSLTEAWGADRLIYGGGFSSLATPQSYRAYREHLRAHLSHLSEQDQSKILGENAERIFGFA